MTGSLSREQGWGAVARQPGAMAVGQVVRAVAGQAGDLQAQHDADQPEADVGHQPLEAGTPVGRRGRLPEVVVDDHDLVRVPAEGHGLLAEAVLPLGTLAVLLDLEDS